MNKAVITTNKSGLNLKNTSVLYIKTNINNKGLCNFILTSREVSRITYSNVSVIFVQRVFFQGLPQERPHLQLIDSEISNTLENRVFRLTGTLSVKTGRSYTIG